MSNVYSLLAIDDSADVLQSIQEIFNTNSELLDFLSQYSGDAPDQSSPKFEITPALSGIEGVALATEKRNAGQPFALAIVDMVMPNGIDGYETIQRLRAIDLEMKIVVFSAYTDVMAKDLSTLPGAEIACIQKPRNKELKDTVLRMVSGQ